ncbi:hypothetical protein PIB30_102427 [Stylosanthes scabra]|uniref:Uncharacterized protein n=1 Tax=Stylosanthes scabra TaxID=79078 RepID=A0ABU6V092_9FABA|nr:hypothetical protein [Stylosanthes scabra]
MPHELPFIHRWVTNDVLGSPSLLTQEYLEELKLSGAIFGGWDLEQRYRVEVAHRDERVCYLNPDHPTVPNWLWVNEVMFTEFGVWVPFTEFQQRLLKRASMAPSQLHPNAWATIQCFELNLAPKSLLGKPEESRRLIGPGPPPSRPSSSARVSDPTGESQAPPEGGSTTKVGRATENLADVSSPRREESPLPPLTASSLRNCAADDLAIDLKRSRPSEVCAIDRFFGASKFIGSNLLGP